MTTEKFINENIGNLVYVTGDRDLAFRGELREIIFKKTKLRLVKMTKSGMAYLHDENKNKYYSVPPKNVREVNN